MSDFFQNTDNKILDLAKYILVLGVIAFLSLLFPNNARFKYEFAKGQTWPYEDLVAPFDFPMRKGAEELKAEKQELLENFSPYYVIEPDIDDANLDVFRKEFEKDFNNRDPLQFQDVVKNKEKYLRLGEQILKRIYTQGVIKIDEKHANKADDFVINIVRGPSTRQQTLQNIATVAKIEDFLPDSLYLQSLKDPDFLYHPMSKSLTANMFYSEDVTQMFKNELLSSVTSSRGKVSEGDLIVSRNSIITSEIYEKLVSYKAEYEEEISRNKSYLGVFSGYLLLTTLSIVIFLAYIKTYLPEVFNDFNRFVFILSWFVVFGWLVFAVEKTNALSAWIIPFCIVPIVIRAFFSDRLAFFTHMVVVLICSFLSSEGYAFAFLQVLAGIVAVMSGADARRWNTFFLTIGVIFMTYALGWLGLSLIEVGSVFSIDYSILTAMLLNVFLTLLAFPIIPLLERVFGFTSSVSLVELSDMNRTLLKRMGLEAPGTLQHSIQVGNLCEAVAAEIGADELLVKTAALYHDIGKIPQAEYFIENQSGYNPHDKLTEKESARIIINHVSEGLKLAKKSGLPKVLHKFIASHHGDSCTEYFYRTYLANTPDGEKDKKLFQYPGPLPETKEETILMLADSLEAACKSLKNPTGVQLDAFIDKIIDHKLKSNQLKASALTFEELEKSRLIFKKLLRSMNHVRVEYPEER